VSIQPRATLPRRARVRARSEFTRVFDGGRRAAHPMLSLHWLPDAQPARLGLAVSRKVDPHAVGRNRIKRILRDAFRRLRADLQPGAYVLVARPAARTSDGAGLRAAFTGLLLRSGALPLPDTLGTMAAAGTRPASARHPPVP
jgi:ribonuclease P protein component